jgi:hypothetical protein
MFHVEHAFLQLSKVYRQIVEKSMFHVVSTWFEFVHD